MKNSSWSLGMVGFAILVSACGNQALAPDPRFLPPNPNAITSENSNNTTPLPGYMQCSESINIRNVGGDLSREYRACAVSGNVGSLRVFPAVLNSENVCIFPAQNGNPFVYGNQFVAQCGALSSSGSVLNFQGFNLNSIYVVPQARAAQFGTCLSSGNPHACSSQAGFTYAFGQI
ncbi:MAG: hypothetical protein KGP28_04655 [Bdellovibrionales bacterium]|nr:hypothetical protein [Bdellovibrionales bacterium]